MGGRAVVRAEHSNGQRLRPRLQSRSFARFLGESRPYLIHHLSHQPVLAPSARCRDIAVHQAPEKTVLALVVLSAAEPHWLADYRHRLAFGVKDGLVLEPEPRRPHNQPPLVSACPGREQTLTRLNECPFKERSRAPAKIAMRRKGRCNPCTRSQEKREGPRDESSANSPLHPGRLADMSRDVERGGRVARCCEDRHVPGSSQPARGPTPPLVAALCCPQTHGQSMLVLWHHGRPARRAPPDGSKPAKGQQSSALQEAAPSVASQERLDRSTGKSHAPASLHVPTRNLLIAT